MAVEVDAVSYVNWGETKYSIRIARTLLIYLFTVIFVGKSDTLFIAGCVSVRFFQVCTWIASINMVLLVAIVLRRDNLLCIWFGMLMCGKFGKKEIAGFSMAKNAQHIRLLIRLSHLPICGWRRKSQISLSTTMLGGLVRSLCWASVNVISFSIF